MEFLLLGGIALGYLATLLTLRKRGRSDVRNFEIRLRQEALLRHDATSELTQSVARAFEALEAAESALKFQCDLSDGRARIYADTHREFRGRLDMVESRVDHTVKVVSELLTDPPAPKSAKRSK